MHSLHQRPAPTPTPIHTHYTCHSPKSTSKPPTSTYTHNTSVHPHLSPYTNTQSSPPRSYTSLLRLLLSTPAPSQPFTTTFKAPLIPPCYPTLVTLSGGRAGGSSSSLPPMQQHSHTSKGTSKPRWSEYTLVKYTQWWVLTPRLLLLLFFLFLLLLMSLSSSSSSCYCCVRCVPLLPSATSLHPSSE